VSAATVRYLKRLPAVGDLVMVRDSEHPHRVTEVLIAWNGRRDLYGTETTVETSHDLGGGTVITHRAGLTNAFRPDEIVGVLPKTRTTTKEPRL